MVMQISQDIVATLLSADSDVCCSILESLPSIIDSLPSGVLIGFAKALVMLWVEARDWKVKSNALAALHPLAGKLSLSSNWKEDGYLQNALADFCEQSSLDASQELSLFEGSLRIWGFAVEAKYCTKNQWTTELVASTTAWLQLVRSGLDEYNVSRHAFATFSSLTSSQEYSLRHAAAQSLCGLQSSFDGVAKMPETIRIGYLLAVYQVLKDDDDDVRDIGAEIVSKVLSKRSTAFFQMVPAAACELVRSCLVEEHGNSEILTRNAISHLTGTLPSLPPKCPKQLMQEAALEQNELFYRERQNLYVDEVSEAEAWSGVLQRVAVSSIPGESSAYLTEWTMEGLDTLIDASKKQYDGALGWTSKAEVFALGMRIIHASNVVLNLERRPLQPRSAVRERLEELRDIGQGKALHFLWLGRIAIILGESA